MSAVALRANTTPGLGQGRIGAITDAHLKKCNAWIEPLSKADGFEQHPTICATDIINMLETGRAPWVSFAKNIGLADTLRQYLLIDMGQVQRTIVWGMAPQESAPTGEMVFRLTARGRRMLQQCCKDLWDAMLYGKP